MPMTIYSIKKTVIISIIKFLQKKQAAGQKTSYGVPGLTPNAEFSIIVYKERLLSDYPYQLRL